MTPRLDLRLAFVEAWGSFRRFPVQFCWPLVSLALLNLAVSRQVAGLGYSGIGALYLPLLAFVYGTMQMWFGVMVARMYLSARDGFGVGFSPVAEVGDYPGLWRTIAGLIGRYIGYALAYGLILLVVALITFALWMRMIARHSGIGAVAGAGTLLPMAVPLLDVLVFYRYALVLPMFAILRGAGPDHINECVRRTRMVRGTMMLLVLAEVLPTSLFYVGHLLYRTHGALAHAQMLGGPTGWRIDLVVLGLTAIYSSFFLLVKTGLGLQVLEQMPLVGPPKPLEALDFRVAEPLELPPAE